MSQNRVVINTRRRDLVISLIVAGVVAFLIYLAIANMGRGVVGEMLSGTIVNKSFTPAPEEQVTVGKGGVHARHVDGEYTFEVRSGEKTFNVWVDREIYESRKVGDSFAFPRPK